MTCCSKALDYSNGWYDPVGYAVQNSERMERFYANYPLLSRVVMVPTNALLGFGKPFLLPAFAAVGLIVQPILATVYLCKGKKDVGINWLKSWTFTVLVAGGIVGFLALTGFRLNLLQGTALIVTGCTISIIIHVYRVAKTPAKPLDRP